MIGEKLGYVPVKPKQVYDAAGNVVKTIWNRFDYGDAAKKLDQNQSYSQALICIAAIEGIMPNQVNLTCRRWLSDGLIRENRKLEQTGLGKIDAANIRPQL